MPALPLRALRPATVLAIAIGATAPAAAQDFYVGQIVLGAWNFCPTGTLHAAGQAVQISQNPALFSLLGTTYGGDGQSFFNLPDLRARVPVGAGSGAGLAPVALGQQGGQDTVTLSEAQIPAHTHHLSTTATGTMQAAAGPASATAAAGNALSNAATGTYTAIGQPGIAMRAGTVSADIDAETDATGGGQPFDNRAPFLGLTWCIVTEGLFPQRP